MNGCYRLLPCALALAIGAAAGQTPPAAAPRPPAADAALVFAPTKVRLKADGNRLAAVVRDFTLQTHIQIDLAREPVELADRPVTLDTGEVSFWEALDALCRQAKVWVRPGDFDPTRAPDATSTPTSVLFGLRGTEQVLVLQDGAPTTTPATLLGAVRVRLLPDRWDNRDRGPGDEHRWMLEVLSEPRVNWQGPPTYHFDPPPGLTANRNPQRPDNISRLRQPTDTPVRNPPDTAYLRELTGLTVTRVLRHELPVYVRFSAAAGKTIPELKGTLSGTVQLSAQPIATINDVSKPDAPAAVAADGVKLTVRSCRRDADGGVALSVEVERPQFAGRPGPARSVLTRAATSGQLPVFPGRNGLVVLNYLLEDEATGFRLLDENGRPYQITAPQDGVIVERRGAGMAVTLTADARPTAPGGQPRRLELLGPRQVAVEAKFTLRDVPRP